MPPADPRTPDTPGSPLHSLPMRLLRCWSRYALPRSCQLLARAGVWDNARWQGEPPRTMRGGWHGYQLRLDIRDYHQRAVFFRGCMLDMPVQLAIRALLRPGDTFIDIGANIGLLSLLGASCVGQRGRVAAFEPAPEMYDRLLWHIENNGLAHVHPHAVALSDGDADLPLTAPADNPGAATLGRLPDRLAAGAAPPRSVRTARGDDLLADLPSDPMLVKLDIEGHEPAALRGLSHTIKICQPAILTESNPEMLEANRSSVDELFGLLLGWGYEPFALTTVWRRCTRTHRIHIHPMPANWRPIRTQNVLFLPRITGPGGGGAHRQRLRLLIRPLPRTSRPVLVPEGSLADPKSGRIA